MMISIVQKTGCNILLFLLLCGILPQCLHAQASYAANEVQLRKILEQNSTKQSEIMDLKHILEQLHERYHLRFIYDDAMIGGIKFSSAVLYKPADQVIPTLTGLLKKAGFNLTAIAGKQYGITSSSNKNSIAGVKAPGQIHVTGVVRDKLGNPLIGVTVKVQGRTMGAVTNANGKFSLDVEPTDSLVISYVGYQNKVVAVRNRTDMEIILDAKSGSLNEVVVVAYGEQKKATVTGAIASISGEALKQSPAANLAVSLAGRLPGLTVLQRNGQPGVNDVNLYIRGRGTTNAQSPIILVDGVERDLFYIDPNEVQSVTILKDASATSLFGVRGANGVIMVTTKRGKAGETRISFSAEYGLQRFTRTPEVVNSYQYALLRNQSLENDGIQPAYSQATLEHYKKQDDPLRYPNTDWYNLLLKKFSHQQRYNLNVSGGTNKVRYFVNAGYLKQNGQFNVEKDLSYNPEFRLKRFNFRSNIDIDLNSTLSAFLNVAGYLEKENQPAPVHGDPAKEILSYMFIEPPNVPPLTPDGDVVTASNVSNPPFGLLNRLGYRRVTNDNVTASYGMKQRLDFITKGLFAKIEASFDATAHSPLEGTRHYAKYIQVIDPNLQGQNGEDSVYYVPMNNDKNTPLVLGSISKFSGFFDFQGQLNYHRSFGKSEVGGLLLYHQEQTITNLSGSGVDYLPYNLLGFSSRLTYGYADRYFLEFDAGYNGSEQFGKGRRFGFFPAISAGWAISNENFMKNSRVLDQLKIRGSYGEVGNDRLGGRRFLYLDDISVGGGGYVSFPVAGGKTINVTSLGNPVLQWEVAKKADIGLDVHVFNSLGLTLDVFREKRNNVLIQRQSVPSMSGLSSSVLPPVNIGIIENKGYEIALTYKKAFTRDFSFLSKINFNYARNKVDFLDEPELPDDFAYRYRTTGYSLGQRFGYIVEGYFTSQDQIDKSPVQSVGGHVSRPGDFKYKDLNGDDIIDSKDLAPIGKPDVPYYTFGAAFSITYKHFDLSLLFQGITGVSNYYSGLGVFETTGNYTKRMLHAWTEERQKDGTAILYPRLSSTSSPNNKANSFFIVNASYMRLKNAEIGYTLPERISTKIGADEIRFYANGLNLITWDDLPTKDFDPEIQGSTTYPLHSVMNFGVNINF